jgi:outer membrane protein assembly factor BamA
LSVTADYSDPAFGGDYRITRLWANWREYVPIPAFSRHVLAFSLSAGTGRGDFGRRRLFWLGGLDVRDLLLDLLRNVRIGGPVIRGYPPNAFSGNTYVVLNTEYRFPVLYNEGGYSTLPLYVSGLHMAVFADGGDATFGDIDRMTVNYSLGAEGRLDLVFAYIARATIRFGYAKGLSPASYGEPGGPSAFYLVLGAPF